MGKLKKRHLGKPARHNPLDQDITSEKYAKTSTRVKARSHQEEDEFVDDKLTKKILSQARQQQEDLEEEVGFGKTSEIQGAHSLGHSSDDDEDEIPDDEDEEEIKISEKDEEAFARFMPTDPVKRAVLADVIKEKLTEKQTEIQTIYSDCGSMKPEELEKVKTIYQGVGKVLSNYRSGKLPKAFKTVPQFSRWEEILYLTEPDKWSAAAMYQATRIFSSNLKEAMAQRFYNLVLLPRLRDDIAECKRLNTHLYSAMKKALFKTGAFFKGIIIPLCESGTCTLREATIFGSVLAKCSIPRMHSGAALTRIAQMGYSGANSIFMRILLEKKYSLPFCVTDEVVAHFLRFKTDDRELPLLWHQCLLTFAQIYKHDISGEQRRELLNLLHIHSHNHITPEVRRELLSGNCRATVAVAEKSMAVDET